MLEISLTPQELVKRVMVNRSPTREQFIIEMISQYEFEDHLHGGSYSKALSERMTDTQFEDFKDLYKKVEKAREFNKSPG